jgi:hypothetical protein
VLEGTENEWAKLTHDIAREIKGKMNFEKFRACSKRAKVWTCGPEKGYQSTVKRLGDSMQMAVIPIRG